MCEEGEGEYRRGMGERNKVVDNKLLEKSLSLPCLGGGEGKKACEEGRMKEKPWRSFYTRVSLCCFLVFAPLFLLTFIFFVKRNAPVAAQA